MTRTGRICLAAFAADAALYLIMLSLPFRALDMGASAWHLGTIPALYAIPYSVTALLTGRRDVPARRRRVLRLGSGLAMMSAAILGAAPDLASLLPWIPLLGIGLGAFWPSLHASFSDAADRRLTSALGQYNMSWSAGKGTGFLAGGVLLDAFGARGITSVAVAALVAAAWFSTRSDDSAAPAEAREEADVSTNVRFRATAWIVNGATFALAATLNHHLPRLAAGRGIDEREFGAFLGLVFFSQTAMFLVLRHWQSWRGRKVVPIVLPASLAAVAMLAPRSSLPMLLLVAPWIGLAMGLAYQASLYYSVRARRTRARDSGVHEAVLQTTAVVIPLAGGFLVAPTGSASAPFAVATFACVATSMACAAMLWREPRVAP